PPLSRSWLSIEQLCNLAPADALRCLLALAEPHEGAATQLEFTQLRSPIEYPNPNRTLRACQIDIGDGGTRDEATASLLLLRHWSMCVGPPNVSLCCGRSNEMRGCGHGDSDRIMEP